MMQRLTGNIMAAVNYLISKIPWQIKRSITDFPGILKLSELFSARNLQVISLPHGRSLVANPLFHANLIRCLNQGGYEPLIVEKITELTRPGMAAYDIGANIGLFTFLFAELVGDDGVVYAFEPEPVNHLCLSRSLALNNHRNVILDIRAVSSANGMNEFDRRGGAFSGRLIGSNTTYKKTGNVRMVETVSIDYLIQTESHRAPDIIKIDVEGNEGMVIAGMTDTLAKHTPIILCEIHSHLGDSAYEVVSALAGHGYHLTDAFNGNPIPLTENECAKLATYIIAVK